MKPLYTTFGFEWTWEVPDFERERLAAIKHMSKMNICPLRIYEDDDTLEVNTSPVTTWAQIKKNYTVLAEFSKRRKWKINAEDGMSGGGHINTGIPERVSGLGDSRKIKKWWVNLHNFIAGNVYLTWIFNDPSDDDNAEIDPGFFQWVDDDSRTFARSLECGQGVRCHHNRIEWRIFDMPRNIKQLHAMVNFVNQVYYRIEQASDFPKYSGDIKNRNKVKAHWKKVLKWLHLEEKDYEYFWKENYLNRLRFTRDAKPVGNLDICDCCGRMRLAHDLNGICPVGGGKFVLAEERNAITLSPEAIEFQAVKIAEPIPNLCEHCGYTYGFHYIDESCPFGGTTFKSKQVKVEPITPPYDANLLLVDYIQKQNLAQDKNDR